MKKVAQKTMGGLVDKVHENGKMPSLNEFYFTCLVLPEFTVLPMMLYDLGLSDNLFKLDIFIYL